MKGKYEYSEKRIQIAKQEKLFKYTVVKEILFKKTMNIYLSIHIH